MVAFSIFIFVHFHYYFLFNSFFSYILSRYLFVFLFSFVFFRKVCTVDETKMSNLLPVNFLSECQEMNNNEKKKKIERNCPRFNVLC